jgi:hypothetical protein
MNDIVEDLRKVESLRGHTFSSYEVINMVGEAANEIERLRAVIRAYLDYCAPEEKWQGEPILLRIRRQMTELLQNQAKIYKSYSGASSVTVGPAAGQPITGCIDPDAPHINVQGNDK